MLHVLKQSPYGVIPSSKGRVQTLDMSLSFTRGLVLASKGLRTSLEGASIGMGSMGPSPIVGLPRQKPIWALPMVMDGPNSFPRQITGKHSWPLFSSFNSIRIQEKGLLLSFSLHLLLPELGLGFVEGCLLHTRVVGTTIMEGTDTTPLGIPPEGVEVAAVAVVLPTTHSRIVTRSAR